MLHQVHKKIIRAISILALFTFGFYTVVPVSAENLFPLEKGITKEAKKTAKYFETIKNDPLALRFFLKNFPKGADLHTHLSGAVYAESFIQWAIEKNLCVLVEIHFLTDCGDPDDKFLKYQYIPLKSALTSIPDYRYRLIDAFSNRNYVQSYGSPSGADQFFASFDKYDEAGDDHDMLADVITRAADQNIPYLEIMMFPGSGTFLGLGGKLDWENDFAKMDAILSAMDFKSKMEEKDLRLNQTLRKARVKMKCNEPDPGPRCDVEVRILAQALRNFDKPGKVFSLLKAAFQLADMNKNVVGVNFVMREDGEFSLRDYALHMRMMDYFRDQYQGVNLSLHAGELAMGLVPPKELTFHIRQAIKVAGAQRIGHGVDIAYEDEAADTLNLMKNAGPLFPGILVEINLTSNDKILGISGDDHPFMTYVRAGVPMALSTDDEGVLRIDLTHEFVRVVLEYGATYFDLKYLSRNAIKYSFLPDDEKTKMVAELEKRFKTFEGAYPKLSTK